MNLLEKLHYIESKKVIYNIHYCNAGVGICFYIGAFPIRYLDKGWRNKLSTEKYYPTFEEAIKEEYKKLKKKETMYNFGELGKWSKKTFIENTKFYYAGYIARFIIPMIEDKYDITHNELEREKNQ